VEAEKMREFVRPWRYSKERSTCKRTQYWTHL